MICPACGVANLPGADRCEDCLFPFGKLDTPLPTEGLQKRLMEDTVADLEPRTAVTIAAEAPVEEAAQLLKGKNVGCVLVMEGETLAGIFSERDVLYKLVGQDSPLSSIKISEVMTPHPVTLRMEDSIRFAIHQMSVGGFRHIPIVVPDQFPRVISVRDVLDYIRPSVADASPELSPP